MGDSTVGLGGSIVESAQILRYRRFNYLAWVAQLRTTARNPRIFSGKSHDLPPAISRRVPSELLDPFDESLSGLPASSHRIVQSFAQC
ncbi:hypothetical protein BHE74_00023624 [Ensete ventricosum]|nr:hypothetical protein GW17_00021678 [Ensete ventricosum]RWW68825.1 hypothetical protein BHE74_00023624 [Ensete ventricosum]